MDILTEDLSRFDRDTLVQLRDNVETALSTLEDRRKQEALAAMEKAAAAAGFTMAELMGEVKGVKPKRTINRPPIKFQNPDRKQQHWNGLGDQPDWFKEKLKEGFTEDQLRFVKS